MKQISHTREHCACLLGCHVHVFNSIPSLCISLHEDLILNIQYLALPLGNGKEFGVPGGLLEPPDVVIIIHVDGTRPCLPQKSRSPSYLDRSGCSSPLSLIYSCLHSRAPPVCLSAFVGIPGVVDSSKPYNTSCKLEQFLTILQRSGAPPLLSPPFPLPLDPWPLWGLFLLFSHL